jgi:hypothetical protein
MFYKTKFLFFRDPYKTYKGNVGTTYNFLILNLAVCMFTARLEKVKCVPIKIGMTRPRVTDGGMVFRYGG